ncbi:hypothetical protein AMS62_27010 [Bacillus sp. FJAT-18019]|nr:hypothetical protein AMS62_27010 [Bacillus sp. FJAT-18019]
MDWENIKNNGWATRHGKELRILSLDGGGIRGVFPATFLAMFEEETRYKVSDYFDMIVGTSTGGILALGLSIGMPAKDLVDLYLENANKIFKKKWFGRFGALTHQYSNDGLRQMLDQKFGDKIIADAKTMLCIPSVEHGKASPKVFKTPHLPTYFVDANCRMSSVALATSAAPTYFPAVQTNGSDCKIDGGLWANNPSIVGIAEAHALNYGVESIKMLSIGTGCHMYAVNNNVAKASSLLRYRERLVELTMQSQTAGAHHMASYMLKDHYLRIDSLIKKPIKLGETRKPVLSLLQHEAREAFARSFLMVQNLFESEQQLSVV